MMRASGRPHEPKDTGSSRSRGRGSARRCLVIPPRYGSCCELPASSSAIACHAGGSARARRQHVTTGDSSLLRSALRAGSPATETPKRKLRGLLASGTARNLSPSRRASLVLSGTQAAAPALSLALPGRIRTWATTARPPISRFGLGFSGTRLRRVSPALLSRCGGPSACSPRADRAPGAPDLVSSHRRTGCHRRWARSAAPVSW